MTEEVKRLHEYAGLILERIKDMEQVIKIHQDNAKAFKAISSAFKADKEDKEVRRRKRSIAKCWKLYNDTLNKIQELTKYTN